MIDFLEKRKKYLIYLPLYLYWLILLTLTSIPGPALPTQITFNDKLEHLSAFMILGILLSLSLKVQNKFKLLKDRFFIATFIIGVVYGSLDEIHQLFIEGRSCDILDVTADTIGVSIGISLVALIMFIDRLKQPKTDLLN